MNLIAKSCFCPGLISLLSNLIKSFGDNERQENRKEWIREYKKGLEHEIYRVELSYLFGGLQFLEVAVFVYNKFSVIVFGIEIRVGKNTFVVLNPGKFLIPKTNGQDIKIYAYIIAPDKDNADNVMFWLRWVEN